MHSPQHFVKYDSVLVATDGSPHAERALDEAIEIARRFDAELYVLSVVDDRLARSAATKESYRELADRAVRVAERRAAERSIRATTAVESGVPVSEIINYASENGIDLIVVGSVAERVVRGAKSSVFVVRS